jgi:hypothetical protein
MSANAPKVREALVQMIRNASVSDFEDLFVALGEPDTRGRETVDALVTALLARAVPEADLKPLVLDADTTGNVPRLDHKEALETASLATLGVPDSWLGQSNFTAHAVAELSLAYLDLRRQLRSAVPEADATRTEPR